MTSPDEPQPKVTTSNGQPPAEGREFGKDPAPQPMNESGQYGAYWVLSPEERAKGFVRPLRLAYQHKSCGQNTQLPKAIAETFAREPHFYGRTFCAQCKVHFPLNEFVWLKQWVGEALLDGAEVGS